MVKKNITIEDAKLIFRNFAGEESKFNSKGKRNFCVLLDPETAKELEEDGWNVKWPPARENGEERDPYLQVKVSFDNFPPKVIIVSSQGKTRLDADTINTLDYASIETADVIIRPYNYEVNGKKGVSAYLKSLYVTIQEDELDLKYADIPDASNPGRIFDED